MPVEILDHITTEYQTLPEIYQIESTAACDLLCPMCFPGDTLISTYSGPMPIASLRVGDEVLTHKGRFRKVTEIFSRRHVGKLLKPVRWNLSPRLAPRSTPEHPFFTTDGFVPASSLTKDSYVVLPKVQRSRSGRADWHWSEVCPSVVDLHKYDLSGGRWKHVGKGSSAVRDFVRGDEGMGRLIGYYLSEGCANDDGIQLTFCSDETEYLTDVMRLLRLYTGLEPKSENSKLYNATTVAVCSRLLGLLFAGLFGPTSSSKTVPGWFYSMPEDFLRGLVSGWIRGDGGLRRGKQLGAHPHPGVCTTSVALAAFMQQALLVFGITHTVGTDYPRLNSSRNTSQIYRLEVGSRQSAIGLYDVVGIKPMLAELKEPKSAAWQRYYEDKVEFRLKAAPEECKFDGLVYNVEVQEDNSYVPLFYGAVHNCPRTTLMQRQPALLPMELLELMHSRGDFGGSSFIELQWSGEPTIHPKLGDIIDFLKDKVGVLVGMSTHGLNLKKPPVAITMLKLDALTISVDSTVEEVYHKMRYPAHFSDLLESLHLFFGLLRARVANRWRIPLVELQLVKTPLVDGSGDIAGLEKLVREEGWQDLCRIRTTKDAWLELDGRQIAGTMPRPGHGQICLNPFSSVSVNQSGDVLSCCIIFEPNKNEINYYGNLWKNSLAEIWQSERVQEMRRQHKAGVLTGQCAKCYAWSPVNIHGNIVRRILRAR